MLHARTDGPQSKFEQISSSKTKKIALNLIILINTGITIRQGEGISIFKAFGKKHTT